MPNGSGCRFQDWGRGMFAAERARRTPGARLGQVNLRKVLEIRQSDECRAFRQWLRDSSHLSDDDLRETLTSLRARVSVATHGTTGKVIRLVLTTLAGVIPAVGDLLSLALSAADSFLLDRIIRKDVVLHFIGIQYPSLFRERPLGALAAADSSVATALAKGD